MKHIPILTAGVLFTLMPMTAKANVLVATGETGKSRYVDIDNYSRITFSADGTVLSAPAKADNPDFPDITLPYDDFSRLNFYDIPAASTSLTACRASLTFDADAVEVRSETSVNDVCVHNMSGTLILTGDVAPGLALKLDLLPRGIYIVSSATTEPVKIAIK